MIRTCDYCGKDHKDVTNIGVGLSPVYICRECLAHSRDEWDTPLEQKDDGRNGEWVNE